MKVKNYKIDDLIEAEYNPRQLTKDQHKQITDSIKRFGIVDPVIVNTHKERKNIIVGGHQRTKVAKELGHTEMPCVEVNLTPEKERELNIRLNKNTGEWDWDELANHFDLSDLIDWGFDDKDLSFFDLTDNEDGLIDDDEVPEVTEAITKEGDIWLLGEHRVLCGDSTKKVDVERLMDGNKADMVYTDPPYGINAVSKSGVLSARYKKDILGDNNIDVAKESFNLIHSLYDCTQIWWGANYYSECLPSAEGWIVWDKNNGGSDQTDCELAWSNFRSVCRLYKQASEKKNRVHPTQKPVSLFVWVIEKFNLKPSIVLDLFLGSGSTLIACEKTNRKCYGMELDPHYCDVIVKRWEQFTGKKAVRLEEKKVNA